MQEVIGRERHPQALCLLPERMELGILDALTLGGLGDDELVPLLAQRRQGQPSLKMRHIDTEDDRHGPSRGKTGRHEVTVPLATMRLL